MKTLRKLVQILLLFPYSIYLKLKLETSIKLSVKLNSFTEFEGGNVVNNNVLIRSSKIGFGTYIGTNCILNNVVIGRFCSIGDNVKVVSATHPSSGFVSTHPAFFSLKKQSGFTFVSKQLFNEILTIENNSIIIGNDVWIGLDTKIIGGIKIGDGAIIAMGSIVTKDVEPYAIVGGVPAKLIRYRFTDEQIVFLTNFQWWNKSLDWIKENANKFTDINIFTSQF